MHAHNKGSVCRTQSEDPHKGADMPLAVAIIVENSCLISASAPGILPPLKMTVNSKAGLQKNVDLGLLKRLKLWYIYYVCPELGK